MIDTTKNIQLFKGDCLEIMKEIPDKSIDMILTDIPYNKVNRKSNGLRNLDKGIADSSVFDLDKLLLEINRIIKGSIYIFCGTEQVSEIRKKLVSFGLSTRHCVWEKSNPSPMNGEYIWLSSIENCIFAKNKKATFNEHCKSSVWKFSIERNQLHPTQKSQKLFNYLIGASSNENDLIFDPFMGSGTTGVACKLLNRRFIGIELSEEYMKIAQERIKNTIKEND